MKPTPSKASHFILGKWSTFTAATLGSMAFLFATPQSEPSGDREIADYLQMNIQTDGVMEGSVVSVRLDGGVARLTGEARSLSQVERASTWAYTIKGVLTVVNQIMTMGQSFCHDNGTVLLSKSFLAISPPPR